MDKVLTVSIASYNVEKTLPTVLDSLITVPEYNEALDIIVVNDGSADGTSKIGDQYQKEYPGIIRVINKENGGYGSTINCSLQNAKGKYFKLLDGDDEFIKENIPSYLNYLMNSDADLMITPYIENRNGNKSIVDAHDFIKTDTKASVDDGYYCMHEITVKTAVLKNIICISEKKFYTDCEYTYYCLKYANSMEKLSLPVYLYNLGIEGQSVSFESIRKHYKDQLSVISKISDDYQNEINHERKKTVIDSLFKIIINDVYSKCLMIGTDAKEALYSFDRDLKDKDIYVYNLCNNTKKIRLLRLSGFASYEVLSLLFKAKKRK